MIIKIDWPATISALLIAATLVIFPFANPCQSEDAKACTWNASEAGNGNGQSFTDYYGITLFHP